jgi:branched-chain amino acid transport system ATP-binding protein
MLALRDIHAGYGRIRVLHGIDLAIEAGELVTLLGANGAGKSTLLKVISGLLNPSQGRILFLEQDLTRRRPNAIVQAGVVQVPEGRQIFADLTVQQNLILGAYAHGSKREHLEKMYPQVFGLFPILKDRFQGKAGSLSGGEQQMLAIARGLMAQPKVLLLDEPSLGLAPLVVQNIFEILQGLRAEGIPILLVEQNVRAALKIADRGYVLETGRIVNQGTAQGLLDNDEVRKRYLGI